MYQVNIVSSELCEKHTLFAQETSYHFQYITPVIKLPTAALTYFFALFIVIQNDIFEICLPEA